MNQRVKELWIEALKTHNKGSLGLHPDEDTFCCLGVLCDVFIQDTGKGEWVYNTAMGKYAFFIEGEVSALNYLPLTVMEWSGLAEDNPSVLRDSIFVSIAYFNDALNYSFEQIATIINESL